MSEHKINTRRVSDADWQELRQIAIEQMPNAGELLEDGRITKAEIEEMLDADGDGRLTMADLKEMTADEFAQWNEVFGKHGFSVGGVVADAIPLWKLDPKEVPPYLWKDRGFVLAAVRHNGMALEYADEVLRKDRDVVMRAVFPYGKAFEFADASLKKDREVALLAVVIWDDAFLFADESLRNDRAFVLEAARRNGAILSLADPKFLGDREIVLAAIETSSSALFHADDSLKKDRTFVLGAVIQNGTSLQFADPSLKKDREIVLTAVKDSGWALQYADASLRANREVVLAAVRQDGRAIKFADPQLKKDREVVLAAVSRDGRALEFADPSLHKDREIVLEAVKRNGTALKYADPQLRKDREIVLAAIREDADALEHAAPSLRKDRSIVLAALSEYGGSLKHADEELKKDREIVLAAVKNSAMALDDAHPSLRKDPEVVLTAMKADATKGSLMSWEGGAIADADDALKDDPAFLAEAATVDHRIFGWEKLRRNRGLLKGVWSRMVERFGPSLEELKAPRRALATREIFEATYDVDFPERFRSFANMVGALRMRGDPSDASDPRPLAVVVAAKDDHNGALSNYPTVDRLLELGYRVAYFEAGDEVEADRALARATGGGARKADVIVLVGHGSEKSLALGGEDLGGGEEMKDERLYIDTGDFMGGRIDIGLAHYLAPTGDLVLDSCSNAKGGDANPDNLANTIARTLPPGAHVHAASAPVWLHSIDRDAEGRLKVSFGSFSGTDPDYTTMGAMTDPAAAEGAAPERDR